MTEKVSNENVIPITISSNSLVSINVSIPANQISYKNDNMYEKFYQMSLTTNEAVYKKPLYIQEAVSADEWKKSLQYSDEEVETVYKKILFEFGLEANNMNIKLLEKMIYDLIDVSKEQSCKKLEQETRTMLRNLITRMTYDKLCVKLDVRL